MGYELFGMLLTREERRQQDQVQMREVLRSHGVETLLTVDFDIKFPEEMTYVSFNAMELNDGSPVTTCIFRLGGVGPLQSDFIYEFSRAADFVFVNTMDGETLILTSDAQFDALPDGVLKSFKQTVVCKSSQELMALLHGGFQRWVALRERVFGNSSA